MKTGRIELPKSEMIEGTEAWARFTNAMKRAIAVPHSEIKKQIDAHRADAAKNPSRPGPKPKKKRASASRVPRG